MGDAEKALAERVGCSRGAVSADYHWKPSNCSKAASELRAIWVLGNAEYLSKAARRTAIKTDREAASASVRIGFEPRSSLRASFFGRSFPRARPDDP